MLVDGLNLPINYQEEFEFSPAQYSFEYGVKDVETGANYFNTSSRLFLHTYDLGPF
jgi:hypothetical protein